MHALNYNNYIFKCDFLYRNQILSSYNFPSLTYLKLSVSSKEFKNFFNNYSVLDFSNISMQTNLYLLFLILFSYKPCINFKHSEENDFNLILNFKQKKANFFLYYNMLFLYSSLIDRFFQDKFKKNHSSLNYFSKISFLNFLEVKLYQKEILNTSISHDLFFDANLNVQLKK